MRPWKRDLFRFSAAAIIFWKDPRHRRRFQMVSVRTRIWLQATCTWTTYRRLCQRQRSIVHDLNDFDEAVLGDYQLDLVADGVSGAADASNGSFQRRPGRKPWWTPARRATSTRSRTGGRHPAKRRRPTASDSYGQLDDFPGRGRSHRVQKKLPISTRQKQLWGPAWIPR